MTEQEILEQTFENTFLPYLKASYNFAFRLTFDEDDAKDLVQDAFVRAFRFYDSFEKGTNAKAWLFRIIKNTFINDYRKKSKEPSKIDYQEVETYYNSEDTEVMATTDLRIETVKDMLGDEITNALNSLSVDFRIIIILCDLEGFSYEEMAKILNIPLGTVKTRLRSGLAALSKMIKK